MLEVTPEERMALVVISILLVAGAGARHLASRAEASQWLEYSAESADTLDPATSGSLRRAAEEEQALAEIRSRPLAPGEKLDPNAAPPEQLARLPRIGPALAERIVASRQEDGPFRSLEDLRRVSGIGPSLLEGIAPYIELPRGLLAGTRGGSGPAARVDINSATAEALEALPGIGPALANRILEHREAHGRFRAAEQLEEVPGIGPRLRERLEPLIRFN